MIDKAEGVFLWLDLMIKTLKRGAYNGDTIDELHKSLASTPGTIEGLYRHIWNKVDERYREDAIKYFRMIMVKAKWIPGTPLTMLSFAYLHGPYWNNVLEHDRTHLESPEFRRTCESTETRILTRCAGLVDIDAVQSRGQLNHTERRGYNSEIHCETKVMIREDGFLREYYKDVKFIHKTAVEFLLKEGTNHFGKSDWRPSIVLALLRGQLGLLNAISIITSARAEGTTYIMFLTLIEEAMGLLFVWRDLIITPDNPSGFVASFIELFEQTFGIVESVDIEVNGSDRDWSDRRGYSRQKGLCGKILSFFPTHDFLGFASFFGCFESIRHHMQSHEGPPKQLTHMAMNTLIGLRSVKSRAASLGGRLNGTLSTMRCFLDHGLDPSSLTGFEPLRWVDKLVHESVWTLFIRQMSDLDSSLLSWEYGQLKEQVESQIRQHDAELWKDMIKCFLAHGARANTSMFYHHTYNNIFGNSVVAQALEASPGSYLENIMSAQSERAKKICELFPFKRVRFHSIHVGDLDPPLSESCKVELEYWYPLSHEQSEVLVRARTADGNLIKNIGNAIATIRENVAQKNAVPVTVSTPLG